MNAEILAYHAGLAETDKAICEALATEINKGLKGAQCKLYHGHPVWFIADNPIVGYHKLKAGVRLLFWSGQTFEEATLKNEGKFKAAGISYASLNDIKAADLKKWLKKAAIIQWDYKNLIKRKGVLERLS